jgi:hypothetical protein
MTTERKELSVNQLDYFGIRDNIKSFLKSQEQFLDYDFEGSGLSVLIDVLSYVTHYQGIYNNLTANELFLDTAVKRSSLVSHAKSLGYTPRSKTSPVATVDLTYRLGGFIPPALPVGEVFSTKIGNKTYNFVNTEPYSVPSDGIVRGVEIREGTLKTITFVTPDSKPYQTFRIKDDAIDTKTIKVVVTRSPSDNSGISDVWSIGTNAVTIGSDSNVYFVEEDYDGAYSVGFGDGIIGKKLEAGNVVTITYLQTKGAEANDAGQNDSAETPSFTYRDLDVSVTSAAAGGSDRESIASIRFNAPKSYAAQNRAVTTGDYEALINNNFSGFQAALVYGGEFATPPEYGKVFVVLKPNTATLVPTSLKNNIQDFLRSRCSVSITPEVKDPTPLYVRYELTSVYNPSKTVLNEAYLETTIKSIVSQFIQDNTIGFNSSISFSKLEKRLLDGVSGLETIEISPSLEYRFFPIVDTATNYEFRFKNPILHEFDGYTPVISSSEFKFVDADGIEKNVYVDDDGFGKLRLFELIGGQKTYLPNVDFGTVDYKTGVVAFNSFALSTINTTIPISIFAKIDGGRLISSETFILLEDTRDPTNAVVELISDNRPDQRTNAAGEIFLGTTSLTSTTTTTTTSTSTSSSTSSTSSGGGY